MDLNPHPPADWTLAGGPYEIADYCRLSVPACEKEAAGETKRRTNVLVLLNAWLDSGTDTGEKWDVNTLNYWLARLRPLWDHEHARSPSEKEKVSELQGIDGESHAQTVVVICNRCGEDNGAFKFS